MKIISIFGTFLAGFMLLTAFAAKAEETMMPYIQGSSDTVDVKAALTGAGFEIVGEYSPYAGAQVIAITSDDLKNAVSQSDFGGYGAAIRVSITNVAGQRQIAYNNPTYMSNIYQMSSDLSAVKTALVSALGNQGEFGAKQGLTAKKLRSYRYTFVMPGFGGHMTLASYDSHATAIAAVEAGLAQGKLGVAKVYRVDLPGKDETLFGVGLGADAGDGGDAHVMATVDKAAVRSTAHFPYEMLVSNGDVYMLGARFRIAQSYPSLTMGTFMKISSAPGAIKTALSEAANGAE
ncbi:MAG: hypothetical protein COA60_000715 [Robiginitomaculum sp.]|nr:hypothetical protein [Robiginitomaculum sp.]